MSLNVVSNFAANVAHRSLQKTDMQATASLAKLSIGKRVVSAKDDAASMAVGSRMNSELAGLRQAVVNSGQAGSMLQIADGAMSTVSDILTRMKSLAIQASSANLSATERDFLNVEFQALTNEIDRVAEDTDFNGTKLLDGSITLTASGSIQVADGVSTISAQGVAEGTAAGYSVSFATAATGGTFTINTFDGTNAANGTYTGSIDSAAVTGTAGALARATTVTLTGGTTKSAGSFALSLNTVFASTASFAAESAAYTGTTELDLTFKLGTGTGTEDSLSFTLDSVNTSALGLTSQTIDTEGNANAALSAVNSAIDTLNEFRADVGAAQNRLEFASDNLNISIENQEAARSTLLDLDIAAEMTRFSSKQVLMQTGVAMLAQANQMPQNLLRLLQ
jgi:flagellin